MVEAVKIAEFAKDRLDSALNIYVKLTLKPLILKPKFLIPIDTKTFKGFSFGFKNFDTKF